MIMATARMVLVHSLQSAPAFMLHPVMRMAMPIGAPAAPECAPGHRDAGHD